MQLSDVLVKEASWTHNTGINKLGYSPMQLATGKTILIPGMTIGNVATESMTDAEAVKITIETLTKTIVELRETDMKKKLKECQRVKVMAYQHQGPYLEGDRVWHQNKDGKSWCGSAVGHCQKGKSLWIYSMGEMKKWQLVKLNHVSLWTKIMKIKVVIKSIKERRMMKKKLISKMTKRMMN